MVWAAFVLVLGGGLFWRAYRRPRPRRWLLPRPAARPVAVGASAHRAHAADDGSPFEGMADRYRELLAAGRVDDVAATLRPGTRFAAQVRALTDIGGADARRVLEGLLSRSVSHDPIEQGRCWVDVASALRRLGDGAALPAVLRCAAATADLPAGPSLAAEAVTFPTFADVLADPKSPTGRLAVRAVTLVAKSARLGLLDTSIVVRLGAADHLAHVSENAPPTADPWVTAAVAEAERAGRRLAGWGRAADGGTRAEATRQADRLRAGADRRTRWLSEAPRRLRMRFPSTTGDERAAVVATLFDLRADASALFPTLPDPRADGWADAVRALAWSRSDDTGPRLAGLARSLLKGRHPGPTAVVLNALKEHRCGAGEAVLLKAAGRANPVVRRAAVAAFGWHDPLHPAAVASVLDAARLDADATVRRAAVGALARLGERAAIREFAAGLGNEEPAARVAAALAVADEGVSWLWPDLDALADDADPAVAVAAAEAVHRLRERHVGLTG